ncbi:MAG: translation initiation factor IF-3 [Planctomycetota bacterium]
MNEEIEADKMLVIGESGEQLGVLDKEKALQVADEEDLDLVVVSPDSDPPVCRIMNYGKYKYEQQKKQHQAKKKSHGVELKELRLGKSVMIEQHDIEFKIKKAREFLSKGHRLQIFLQLRGREISHSELGIKRLDEFAAALDDIAKIEQEPGMLGRRINMLLAPLSESAKKKKKADEKKREEEEKASEKLGMEPSEENSPQENNTLAEEPEEPEESKE